MKDVLYRFTPYRRSKVSQIKYNGGKFSCKFEQNDTELQIELYRGSKGGMLFAPDKTNMVEKVKEYLDAKIKFKLRKAKETIIEGNSSNAALEIIGDTKSLIDNFK